MAEARIIYNPGKLVMKMFYRKMNQESRQELAERKYDAVGLFQTTVSGVLYYADRVAKVSNVYPVEINGSCRSTLLHWLSLVRQPQWRPP